MISFYILFKRLHLKCKELSDAKVVSITKTIWFCSRFFLIFKLNICRMIKCDLLMLSFVWNFHKKKMCTVQLNILVLGNKIVIKTVEILSFLPLINSSVTIRLSFLLLIISGIKSFKTINTLHFLLGLYSLIFS